MYRLIISFLLEGVIAGGGLALFMWLGRYKLSVQTLVGFIAAIMLVTFIRLIPALSIESTFQQMIREAGDDQVELEALLNRKPRPLVSVGALVLFGFLSICGLIVRASR